MESARAFPHSTGENFELTRSNLPVVKLGLERVALIVLRPSIDLVFSGIRDVELDFDSSFVELS